MVTTVRRIKLGCQGLEVSAQGLGCAGMSSDTPKSEGEMIKVIRHAIDSGITHLDTSSNYGPYTNEILIGKALKGGYRGKVQLATKFGFKVLEDGSISGVCGDPEYVRASCEASLKRLDIDYIDLYFAHRVDTRVPIEVTMGEIKKLVEEGKIKYIGLCEASPETIRRAHAVHPISAVQLEWSLWTRDAEASVIPTCRELGIGIVAYSPLGSGFFASGPDMINNMASDDIRRLFPRFQPENFEQNLEVFERVNRMARKKGCAQSQLALAWLHHLGDDVCPIPGTTKIENLKNNIKALSIKLTSEEMAELESLADAVKGERLHDLSLTWKYANTPPLSGVGSYIN